MLEKEFRRAALDVEAVSDAASRSENGNKSCSLLNAKHKWFGIRLRYRQWVEGRAGENEGGWILLQGGVHVGSCRILFFNIIFI